MKKILCFLIIFFASQMSFPQTNLDSIWNIWLDESRHDIVRFQALMDYPDKKWKWSQPDSTLYFGEIAYEFAHQRDLKWQMAYALQRIGVAYSLKGNYEQALIHGEKSLALGKETNDKNTIARAAISIGAIYIYKGDHETAVEYYKQAMPLYEQLGDQLMLAECSYWIGSYVWRKGNYYEAIDYITKSYKLYEELGRNVHVAACLVDLGWIYFKQDDYQVAMEYFQKALHLAKESNDKKLIAASLSSIAGVYNNESNYEKALEYYEQSLAIKKEMNNQKRYPVDIYNIGITYKELENYPKALVYLFESLKIFEEQVSKQHIAMTQARIGRVYLMQKKYSQAIQYAEKGIKLAKEVGVIEEHKDAAEVLYKSYKATGNLQKALANHEEWWALTDSTKKEDTDKKLQLFEFERQRMADSLVVVEDKLRAELAFQETLSAEKQTRNTFMYAGLGILLIAGGLFGRMRFIRRTNKKLEEKNRIIAEEKAKVEVSEKAKEQFFNNVSHEFRTPLTLILGPVAEELRDPKDEESKRNLQIAHRSALRLQGMINELLSLSKLEFGKLKLKIREENIVRLTKDYLQSFESMADQRKINLGFKSMAKEYKAWVDVEQFRKILANLISNAFKFTEEGGEVNVSVGSQQSTVPGIVIKVSDNGIGISNDKLPHIFDRFFQTGEGSFSEQAGTGIGLALTKELVELHHGKIEVESEKGRGTTFSIFIPMGNEHFSEEELFVEESVIAKEQEKPGEWFIEETISIDADEGKKVELSDKPVVLIVEDNPDMLTYIKTQLDKSYTILTAKDGEDGLAKALDNIPDLVISDVMMPRLDGNEMTERLKTDSRTSHIPVVLLTARASVDSKIEGLETGADAYQTKPFNARELKVRVKKLIEQRQKLRELFASKMNTGDTVSESVKLPSMDQKFIQKAMEVVNEHISDTDFDVNEFANEMALSRVQVHRKLKAISNKSASEFIKTIRLNKAAELLQQKTDNITQIAYETGFSSLSYFAKVFKERFGVTPSEFSENA